MHVPTHTHTHTCMLNLLRANSADQKWIIFFLFFPENRSWHFIQRRQFAWNVKNLYFSMSPADFSQLQVALISAASYYTPDIRSMWGYIVFAFPFVRSFVRTFVRSSFRHRVKVFALKFIRPQILKTLWWISFIFGMMVDIGLKFLSAPSPTRGWPWGQGHRLRIFIKKSGSKFLR